MNELIDKIHASENEDLGDFISQFVSKEKGEEAEEEASQTAERSYRIIETMRAKSLDR